jgi:pimeloyl-ACP methyl ester carboxylesterase
MTDITIENRGIRLAASVDGPADSKAILFLHGLSHSRDTWEEAAKRLTNQYRVWTLDFRGHGHSDRASSYKLADFVSDAETALATIGQPAIIVGHSLGGCVAGVLGQSGLASVRGIFLEDPPWYLGEPGEWERSVFPKLFSIVSARQQSWQQERAPLATYLNFVSNSPSPMGGIGSDHISQRHLLSHASALQRQDVRCWESVMDSGGILAEISTKRAFACPAKIIQADPRFGSALLEGHEARLARTNPKAEIVQYRDCGHGPHRTRAFEDRFIDDLSAFILAWLSK